MQKLADKLCTEFKKPADDPDFYAAKAGARKMFPHAQMIELFGRTMTVVIDGEAHKLKI